MFVVTRYTHHHHQPSQSATTIDEAAIACEISNIYIYKKNENSRFDEEAKGGDTEARENEGKKER